MILDLLAVCGLVFLIIDSNLTRPVRVRLTQRLRIAYGLLGCAFCTGIWAGAATWSAWMLPPWASLAVDGAKFTLAAAYVAHMGRILDAAIERHGTRS